MLETELIALALPAIPTLVRLVESIFTKPKSGTNKKSAIIEALRGVFTHLLAASPAPDNKQPSDEMVSGVVEAVFQQLKATGQLTAPVQPAGAMYLVQGTVTPLKVG